LRGVLQFVDTLRLIRRFAAASLPAAVDIIFIFFSVGERMRQ
jgi:hypothetical protein